MRLHHVALLLVTCSLLSNADGTSIGKILGNIIKRSKDQVKELQNVVTGLSRQVMLQQFFVEEKIRNDGNSGVKLIRGGRKGKNNYDGNSHLSNSYMAIHDHSNYDRTIGMGNLVAVLNGVEFRTRHNDYKLYMPDPTSDEFHAVKEIKFPDVPPEVTGQPDVESQVKEMREWFRAFWTQNATHRNYPKYFKPVISYLEGAWTLDGEKITEGFKSDRHAIAASSWFDLQEKVRFSAFSGVKDLGENLAYLPTTIIDVNTTTGTPKYAQWNYRIMCYPLDHDLPFTHLQQVEDLAPRVSNDWTRSEVLDKRAARYQLWDPKQPENDWHTLLDKIMYQIPGKDNYYKNMTQDVFGNGIMYDIQYGDEKVKLDVGRYHRWYRSSEKDAMGVSVAARSFNDDYMFAAQTSKPNITSLEIRDCKRRKGRGWCEDISNSFSYAIPLEIIYLTPLLSWNPYNLKIHKELGIADADGRNGEKKAYDGVDSQNYYLTPVEFFKGVRSVESAADTVRNSVYVRSPDGERHKTAASGTQIMLQEIEGVGRIRTRYPIAPVHGEGNSVWRELNALRDTVTGSVKGPPQEVEMEMYNNGTHTHRLRLSYNAYLTLVNDRVPIDVYSDERWGHSHLLNLRYNRKEKKLYYHRCDGKANCFDGHPKNIKVVNPSVFTEFP